MKNKLAMRLKLLALSALLCAPAPQLLAQTTPVLKAERSGEKLILSWSGGQNIRLQSSSCLCGPYWQYLPDSDTNCVVEAALNEPAAFFRLVDTLADTDADLLTRAEEEAGWTIFIDTSGYSDPRIIAGRLVTSDPDLADTDGDGLDDFLEWIYGTDPRAADTDHDGLSDSEEVFRWHTSPASADTDGDSRGPDHNLPPKAALFDGNELRLLHTSPTLEDTDGDGRTDYEEYDQLGRSPLVAQLPNIEVRLVDAVDIRLDVQYAESAGQSHQYGSQITTSTTTTEKDAWTHTLQWSLKLGAKSKFGLFSGAEGEFSTEFTFGSSHSYTSEKSTAEMTQKAITDYTTDSRTRTETAASGSMSAGVQLVNTGPVTYTLTDLGVTVRYWSPGPDTTNRSFKTLATLVPALAAGGITLAPGDSTPVLQVQASGLNASRVKEFMARPNSLYLEPAFYELENAQGLNFDFLEEVTRWRTARVEIDYGDGRNEQFRVATNVERTDDGGYAGIPMGTVLSNILRIPFQTVPLRSLGGEPSDRRVLHAVRDCVTTSPSNGFWIVASSSRTTPLETPDFENITLHAGDQILLAFIRDEDGDGLFAPEEQHHGTLDTATPDGSQTADSDRDGLTDVFEARAGWDVVVLSRTNHVYSDPRQTDQDGDGLTDLQEYQLGTDPARPDTDDDGLPDSRDPHPLVPAKVLRVKADAFAGGNSPTNGATWASAFTNLQDALTQARNGAATATNSDDVAEIWVAAGTYRPATSTTNRSARFELVNNIALYGGFTGLETKLSQRNPDPLFNGTVLTGDLMNNDASTYDGNAASFADNCTNVCYAATNVGTGALLDGFTITGGNASLSTQGGGGLFTRGYPRLKNLLFRANYGYFGGGLFLSPVAPGELSVSDCLFLQNDAYHGGGIGLPTVNPVPSRLLLSQCQFVENGAVYGGAVYASGPRTGTPATLSIEACTFGLNSATTQGGAVFVHEGTGLRTSRSDFRENSATSGGAVAIGWGTGGVNINAEVVQCLFFKNSASQNGGAISAGATSPTILLYILSSSFSRNSAAGWGRAVMMTDGGASCLIENSVLWDNDGPAASGDTTFGANWAQRSRVRSSCLAQAGMYPGAGNVNADPKFVDSLNGNLRLQSGSPCLDRGNNYADYYPTVPGFQLLPTTDLDGNWRVVDGNTDGTPTVDIGAYERQGP